MRPDLYIKKVELEKGMTYRGFCRNATEATWNGKVFVYVRQKFGHKFEEEIEHPEDDRGFDVFFPVEKLAPNA